VTVEQADGSRLVSNGASFVISAMGLTGPTASITSAQVADDGIRMIAGGRDSAGPHAQYRHDAHSRSDEDRPNNPGEYIEKIYLFYP
jgi:hypothetical protein